MEEAQRAVQDNVRPPQYFFTYAKTTLRTTFRIVLVIVKGSYTDKKETSEIL